MPPPSAATPSPDKCDPQIDFLLTSTEASCTSAVSDIAANSDDGSCAQQAAPTASSYAHIGLHCPAIDTKAVAAASTCAALATAVMAVCTEINACLLSLCGSLSFPPFPPFPPSPPPASAALTASGVSPGGVAGIVIGLLLAACLVGGAWVVRERMRFAQKRRGELLAEARLEWHRKAAAEPLQQRHSYQGLELQQLEHGGGQNVFQVGRCKVDPLSMAAQI